jgi:hypothetical protein
VDRRDIYTVYFDVDPLSSGCYYRVGLDPLSMGWHPVAHFYFSGSTMTSILRRCLPFCLLAVLIIGLSLIPATLLGGRPLLVALAARAVLGVAIPCLWVGWATSWLLLPPRWKEYELLIMPLVGMIVLIPACYLLNFLADMRTVTLILMVAVVPLVLLRQRCGQSARPPLPTSIVPWLAAFGLLVVALVPHLIQGSLGLLAQSVDEETYFYLSRYLLSYPSGATMPGPAAPVLEFGSDFYRSLGWGFPYLLAMDSAIGGADTFQSYLPVCYFLLSLGVLAWYVFFREVMQLPHKIGAGAATLIYCLHGLPLWFASYGYARQTIWIALVPLVWSALVLAIRSGEVRAVLLAGLSAGTLLSSETRVGGTTVVVTVCSLLTYWLICDRKMILLLRIAGIGAIALVSSAPVLFFFVRTYAASWPSGLLSGQQDGFAAWGPGISGYAPIQVVLGLEPHQLVRILDPIPELKWIASIDPAMTAVSPYVAWAVVLLVAVGVIWVWRRSPIAIFIALGYLSWMAATQFIIKFPYGHFKMIGIAAPLLWGLAVAGACMLKEWASNCRLRSFCVRNLSFVLVFGGVLLFAFVLRNSAQSLLFGVRGWGLSIPVAMTETLGVLESIPFGKSVFITGNPRFPVSDQYYRLRKQHALAMQSKEETSLVWGERFHALAATNLVGREVYGVFKAEATTWSRLLPDDEYDYYLLYSDEDPRCRGLDRSDLVTEGEGLALYRSPGRARAGATRILSGRGSLRVDGGDPLTVIAGPAGYIFGVSPEEEIGPGLGRVRLGMLALKETVVTVRMGRVLRQLALDPGLTWYTTPTVSLPEAIGVEATDGEPLQVVALRSLPPGDELLDRSLDSIVSSEIKAGRDGVDVELWVSNPMRDAKDAKASLGIAQNLAEEQVLSLNIGDGGDRGRFRLPSSGSDLRQLSNGGESTESIQLPWVQNGGQLSLFFKLGHERPREVPLGLMTQLGGGQYRLDSYPNPVQVPLWGYDDRPKEKMPPPLSSLEGKIVASEGGFKYLVKGGRRHWIPASAETSGYGSPLILSPEQLWLIPPGLPEDAW